jgi:hypothetical protein
LATDWRATWRCQLEWTIIMRVDNLDEIDSQLRSPSPCRQGRPGLRQTNTDKRQTGRQAGRQADRQTGRQADRQTDTRQIDRRPARFVALSLGLSPSLSPPLTWKSNASPRSWNPIPTYALFPPSPSTRSTKYLELSRTGSTCVQGLAYVTWAKSSPVVVSCGVLAGRRGAHVKVGLIGIGDIIMTRTSRSEIKRTRGHEDVRTRGRLYSLWLGMQQMCACGISPDLNHSPPA